MSQIDQIRAEIERRIEKYGQDYQLLTLLEFIDNLERKEQPVCDGLEEAAEKYSLPNEKPLIPYTKNDIKQAFKAGAMWDREQGVTKEGVISRYANGSSNFLSFRTWFPELDTKFQPDDKVIIQIRKKDE